MAKLWPSPAPVWSEVVETGFKSCFVLLGINSFFINFGSKSFPVPGDAPDGQVWAISSIGGVRGGPYWYQIIYF